MRFFKLEKDGYIQQIGIESGGTEITESEYNEIFGIIKLKPRKTETIDYRLKTNLTWESYQIDPPDPDPELDADEALNILLGNNIE